MDKLAGFAGISCPTNMVTVSRLDRDNHCSTITAVPLQRNTAE